MCIRDSPFEPYSGDWTVGEPMTEEMLASLNQAQTLLFSDKKKEEEKEKTEAAAAAPEEKTETNEPGKQDA